MRPVTAVLFSVVIFALAAAAQDSQWEFTISSNLLLSLNTYSDNWTGGDAGSVSWAAKLDAEAAKQLSEKLHNRNTLKLAFGQTKIQDSDTKKWGMFIKSTDKIEAETMWRLTLGWKIDPFASVRLESQFLDLSDPGEDRYINPLNLIEAIGASAQLVKKERVDWTARLGVGGRQLIDRDQLQPDLTRETDVTNDAGFEFATEFAATNEAGWLTYKSILKAYEALISTEADETDGTPAENEWHYPDVNWENDLTVNINKYVMLNLYVQVLYDKELHNRPRVKETLSLGLTFNYTNKAPAEGK
jgi:hypothetical protein